MKKIYLLLIFITGLAHGQIVNIPDPAFKAYLIEDGYGDENGDIQASALTSTTFLNIESLGISDLTGIEAFTNLHILYVGANNLTSLDLSALVHLTQLHASHNQLSSINLSGLTLLTYLDVVNNQFTAFDISGLPALDYFICSENQITSLSVSGRTMTQFDCILNPLTSLDVSNSTFSKLMFGDSPALTSVDLSTTNVTEELYCSYAQLSSFNLQPSTLIRMDCSHNQFTTLDVSGFANLEMLSCQNNQLTNLNVSGLAALTSLNCGGNQLETLNLDGLSKLKILSCNDNQLTLISVPDSPPFRYIRCQNNNLEYVNLKNGYFSDGSPPLPIQNNFSNNPNLQFICTDDNEVNGIQNALNTFGPPGVVVNSYCSFNPGGDYNTITGNLTNDQNGNGCDAADTDFPYIKMNINNGTSQGMTFSTNDGNYTFFTGIGNFTVTPDIENPAFFNISPANVVVNFADNSNNTSPNDFCISPNGVHNDLEIVIAPMVPARPGFDAKYTIVYKNKGNQVMSLPNGIILQYDNNALDFVSASEPISGQGTDSLNWDYINLLPFESRSITVIFNVNAPTDTPPVNINDLLPFTAGISPNNNDESIADNTFVYTQTVVGSFDPNDITCLEGDVVSPVEIGNYLHYIINFENTGTYPAENIVVKEIIDPAKFDLSSLRILTTSHDMKVKVAGNVLEMIFKDIQLGPGEHGSILLKIKSSASLVTDDSVAQHADIFFDYNFPVTTNVATTVFSALSIGDTIKDNSLSIYPNPAYDVIHVDSVSEIRSLEFFDVQGRLLLAKTNSGVKSTLDISNSGTGVYYVRITTEKGIKTEKIIKN